MNDKLKDILSKNSKAKEEAKKKKVKKPEEKPEEPIETEEPIEDEDLEEEDDEEEDTEETVKSEPQEQISEEELERLKAIDQEIARLRDHGVFNAEVLFQVIKVNENLDRIAKALESLVK